MESLKDLLKEGYPLREEKPTPPYKIYCDMDGVLQTSKKGLNILLECILKSMRKKKGLQRSGI